MILSTKFVPSKWKNFKITIPTKTTRSRISKKPHDTATNTKPIRHIIIKQICSTLMMDIIKSFDKTKLTNNSEKKSCRNIPKIIWQNQNQQNSRNHTTRRRHSPNYFITVTTYHVKIWYQKVSAEVPQGVVLSHNNI